MRWREHCAPGADERKAAGASRAPAALPWLMPGSNEPVERRAGRLSLGVMALGGLALAGVVACLLQFMLVERPKAPKLCADDEILVSPVPRAIWLAARAQCQPVQQEPENLPK